MKTHLRVVLIIAVCAVIALVVMKLERWGEIQTVIGYDEE